MTCIVGLEHEGKVYIGADSMAATNGWDQLTVSSPKVFKKDDFLIGYTTSFRMGQILKHHLKVNIHSEEMLDEEYMVTEFIESVRTCLKEKGFSEINNNKEDGGNFLVGYHGKLYEIGSDYQINRWREGIASCGCGADFAKAVVKVLGDRPPMERIRRALEIADYFSAGVKPPFQIEVL